MGAGMKTWLITRERSLFLFFSVVLLSGEIKAREFPYILEIQKNTPLYDRPSLNGKKVATAEEGTNLLFIEKSKKGLWVKLKDGDGLEGWMPIQGTDLTEVLNATSSRDRMQEISKQEKFEDKKISLEEQQREILAQKAASVPFDPFLRIAPLMRWLSDSEPVSTRLGIRVDYNLARYALVGKGRMGRTWAVAEATFPRRSPGRQCRREGSSTKSFA